MLLALQASFAFLTVLVPGRMFDNSCMKNSTFFYPVVGIVLGFILTCSSILVLRLSSSPSLASIAYIIFSFFLTRGLHHDGLADTADAWGSGARGAKFREILKDSRIGSFGTIVLILYFLLCYTALTSILSPSFTQNFTYSMENISSMTFIVHNDAIFLLFSAPIWGRIGLLMQAAFDMPYVPNFHKKEPNILKNCDVKDMASPNNSSKIDDSYAQQTENNKQSNESNNPLDDDSSIIAPTNLSQNMVHRFQKARFFLWFSIFIILFLFYLPPIHLVFTLGGSFLVFMAFYFLSKRENGYNGDFLGAQCLCFETIIFLNIYV